MEQPLVTIVVISYNQGKYIRENLDSIKAQTYSNIELIVGDDASQDNSVQIFENWLQENNYSAAFKNYHQRNTGLATMLNECNEKATGKYIKLIAADDYLHPEAIEKCVAKLEEAGEECGMVFTDTFCINDTDNRLSHLADFKSVGKLSPIKLQSRLLQGNCIAALTVVMRRNALIKTGPYDARLVTEDYSRWLRISADYTIAYVAEKLAYYRVHESNISRTKAERITDEVVQLQMKFDKCGYAKDKVNQYFESRYLDESLISSESRQAYAQYPFGKKRLRLALKYKLPSSLYRCLCKIV